MTDFGGKGSRRVFADRLLRAAQVQASSAVTNLVPSILSFPAGSLVESDRLPAVSVNGVGKTLTPASFLSYILPDSDKGDITVSGSGATWTIDNDAVTYAKMQNVSAASRLLGRGSASGAGDVEELTLGTGLTLTGTVLSSGDVFGPASATDNAIVRYDGTTGKLVQNSAVTIADTGQTLIDAGSTAIALQTTTTASINQRWRYDSSNYLQVNVQSTGNVIWTIAGTAKQHNFSDPWSVQVSSGNGTSAASVTLAGPTGAGVGLIGISMTLQGLHTSGSADIIAGSFSAAQNGVGNVGSLYAVRGVAQAGNASTTVTNAIAVSAVVTKTLGTITNGIGLDVEAMSVSMTNAYGLRIGNITGGTGTNHAIKTGTGLVDFGDKVNATAYAAGGTDGIDFSGPVTNITVVKGIVTAAS